MNQQEAQDFIRDYNETYVFYDGRLAWITRLLFQETNNGDYILKGRVFFGNKDEGKTIVINTENVSVPEIRSTLFNVFTDVKGLASPACHYIRRRPRRQWQQGLCSGNINITQPLISLYPFSGLTASLGMDGDHIFHKLMEAALIPTFMPTEEAIKEIEKWISVAISPDFCITLSPIKEAKILLQSKNGGFIGEIIDKKIVVHHKMAEQEVQDFFRNSMFEVVIA